MASEATLLEQGDVAAPKGANQMEHLCRNCGVKAIDASLATHRSHKPYASIPTRPVRHALCHERRKSRHRTPGLFLGHAHGSQRTLEHELERRDTAPPYAAIASDGGCGSEAKVRVLPGGIHGLQNDVFFPACRRCGSGEDQCCVVGRSLRWGMHSAFRFSILTNTLP